MKIRLGLSMLGLTLLLLPVTGHAADTRTKAIVRLEDAAPRVTKITEAPHVDFGTVTNHEVRELTARRVNGKLEVLNTNTPAKWNVQLTADSLVGRKHKVEVATDCYITCLIN